MNTKLSMGSNLMVSSTGLKQLLGTKQVKHQWTVGSKAQLLKRAAIEFSEQSPTLNPDDLFNCLIKRERLGTTCIGQGVALPHCRSSQCTQMQSLFISLKTPIDFDSADGGLVDLCFILLAPQQNEDEHLQTLKLVAAILQEPRNRMRIRRANNHNELHSTLLDLIPHIEHTSVEAL